MGKHAVAQNQATEVLTSAAWQSRNLSLRHSLFFTLCTATAATNKICHFFLGVCVSNTPFRHTSSHPIRASNYILRVALAVIAQVILHAPLLYAISNILGKIARFHSLVWKQVVVLTSHVYVWFLSVYCISFSLKLLGPILSFDDTERAKPPFWK